MQSVVLLDGGLGQEIYRRARNVSSPLWSVAVMQEQPEVVTAVHADFIRAGAKTLTLNTYTATPSRLRKQDMLEQLATIHQQAFDALRRAIETTGAEVDIAGCLPPLAASYQGKPPRSFEDLRDEYALLARLQGSADVFLIETMTNTLEARAACAAASDLGKPYGIAFRLEANGKLKSGETLAEAVAAVTCYAPTAVMLNCCDPELMTAAMPALVGMYSCTGGYANAFKSVETLAKGGSVDALEAREDLTPAAYIAHVQQWLANGATVVGGCCDITPAHIRHMANVLADEFEFIRFSKLALQVAVF
ncbi:homocysteine S-methyltransferase [Marinobacter sp. LV10R510-11A]|uniref:homocysteine S-methyltransferase family protein n=1 Tax=Marinobacter sp. LV10R510-11A TaxID=1415568 RepID=UPI000BB6E304|nr:homocysteine S-methyltransferase family protein [Marinobacter sp. LV10R510-11A]SOB76477.1 homocysteine S-methyltransferase [Marinobacter sp. LV10R510-11A]